MNTSSARTANAEVSRSRRRRDRWATRPRKAIAIAATTAMLWGSLGAPAWAEDGLRVRKYDRGVMSELAENVLRQTGADLIKAESAGPSPGAPMFLDEAGTTDDPVAPAAHIAPAQEGITVAIPPGVARQRQPLSDLVPAGYQSNTWRQRPVTPRGLSFSSGTLAPASGLDPALKAHERGLRGRGRDTVYGFLLLRVPPDEALERTLADVGVKLLGPHDDHHKARLTLGMLEAVAALPEVEWVGVSSPKQKQSRELAELRGAGAKAAHVDRATPIPIVVNLFDGDDEGTFGRELEAAGVAIGRYDADLHSYRAVATGPTIDKIAGLDFVQFVELIEPIRNDHDQSMALVDADLIRPGTPLGLTRYSGASTIVGILDGGFSMTSAAPFMHQDLNKLACGKNFTNESGGAFNDLRGHGTHVIATIVGTGTANPRFKGVAPGVGTIEQIRAAKVTEQNGEGDPDWAIDGMNFMSSFSECASAPPDVINISFGQPGTGFVGTDDLSRKLDEKVWQYGQAYVVSAGNSGSNPSTIGKPGVAKNALTVGNVFDRRYLGVGDIANTSSRGPTGDGRMKPNIVAPGNMITSAMTGNPSGYVENHGTSFSTPHVTGLVATLMEHYPQFKGRPAFLRSHLMATAIAHDDVTGPIRPINDYGLGRVSGYLAHWSHPNSAGWTQHWFHGGINSFGYAFGDVTVPPNAKRLVVVLTWDEPPASSGASQAVSYNIDLYADHNGDCGLESGACGEYYSLSTVDNVEYIVIENPPAGYYRLNIVPVNAPTFQLRYGLTAMVIRGDTTPAMFASLTPPASSPVVGSTFQVKMSVANMHYVASGVQIQPSLVPSGVTPISVQTTRHDGETMFFPVTEETLTLGNLLPNYSRQATYFFKADTPGTKTLFVRAWSENGGQVIANTTFEVLPLTANLIETAMGTSPAAPIVAPGGTFTVTDTVQNLGPGKSVSSRTRYYASLDAVKGAGDILLTGTHSVPELVAGARHTATVKLTVPAATAPNQYFLLACADDLNAVMESEEGDNCVVSPGATVTLTRPDLVASAVSAPPATAVRGARFRVTDTALNLGAVPSASVRMRYYLSLDGAKSTTDKLLSGSRSVPGLAAGASHSGTVTVAIPTATAFGTYFLLSCVDAMSAVVETNETNNCVASTSTVTVRP